METIFVFGMLLVLLITARGGAGEDAVPLLGLCAYGGFRILPSINRILLHWNSIRFGAAGCHYLYDDMMLFERHRGDGRARPAARRIPSPAASRSTASSMFMTAATARRLKTSP